MRRANIWSARRTSSKAPKLIRKGMGAAHQCMRKVVGSWTVECSLRQNCSICLCYVTAIDLCCHVVWSLSSDAPIRLTMRGRCTCPAGQISSHKLVALRAPLRPAVSPFQRPVYNISKPQRCQQRPSCCSATARNVERLDLEDWGSTSTEGKSDEVDRLRDLFRRADLNG